jgi:two-component system response regulator
VMTSNIIMIVEDSDDDFEATERALRRDGRLANPLLRFESGEEALDYLLRRDEYSDPASSPRPCIVLLDLNMPGAGGYPVLSTIKQDPELKRIPVIVLTTSNDIKDIQSCYDSGANTYIRKPVDLDGFFQAIRKLKEYWLDLAVLPEPKS